MTKSMVFFLASVLAIGLTVVSASPRPPFDKQDRKELHKLMKEENKRQKEGLRRLSKFRKHEMKEEKRQRKAELKALAHHRRHHRRHMRFVALHRRAMFGSDNFGRRRSALAHRQNTERRALHIRQMEGRRLARPEGLNRSALAMRQNDERRLLQQRQRIERRAIHP